MPHGIEVALAAGAGLGMVGASDSGETTLLRTVDGLHRLTAGTVTLEGERLASAAYRRSREQRRRHPLVPQKQPGTLNPSRTVHATLRRPPLLHRRTGRAEAPACVVELATR
ncbi:ATP-binding cassette domain-containing protein [Streptomyces sp. NPDC055099]